jgi:deoxyribonuclease V
MSPWPTTTDELVRVQRELAAAGPPGWTPPAAPELVGGCFACFARGITGAGARGDPGAAGAALSRGRRHLASSSTLGSAGGPYLAALLALREGALLEAAVRALDRLPEVLLVNATGRDHPRQAGLALHLGAVLGLPTVGVTNRTLAAAGAWPDDRRGAAAPLRLGPELVGYWLRTRPGAKPVAVHAAWRTDPDTAVEVVLAAVRRHRTPEPLRRARTAARTQRGLEVSAGRWRG